VVGVVALQVGQGKVQEMAAQAVTAVGAAATSQGADDGAATARHAAEEARMLQLLAERAATLDEAMVWSSAYDKHVAGGPIYKARCA
jgi:hypothetical protein